MGCGKDETLLLGGRPLGPLDQEVPQGLGDRARLGPGLAIPEFAEVLPGRPVDAGSEQDGGEDCWNGHQAKGDVEEVDHAAHFDHRRNHDHEEVKTENGQAGSLAEKKHPHFTA